MASNILASLRECDPFIGAGFHDLSVYIEQVGDPILGMRIGREELVWRKGAIEHTLGTVFRNLQGTIQGGRFLIRERQFGIVAGAYVSFIDRHIDCARAQFVVLSDLYVDPAFRGCGLAKRLIGAYLEEYPRGGERQLVSDEARILFGPGGPRVDTSSMLFATLREQAQRLAA